MPIVPDTKDWTWVLETPCGECGFSAVTTPPTEVPGLVRANASAWRPLLLAPDGSPRPGVAERPADDRWSALEYACHVRDVFRLFDERLRLMLTEDDPRFANWDQDVTAVEDRYAEQPPAVVADDLEAAGAVIAATFAAVRDDQWSRTGTRSDGAAFTVDTFARYFVHDPIHHVWDVRQGYALLAAPGAG
jgi:DinB superfamily